MAFCRVPTRCRLGHVPMTIITRSGLSEYWHRNKQLSNSYFHYNSLLGLLFTLLLSHFLGLKTFIIPSSLVINHNRNENLARFGKTSYSNYKRQHKWVETAKVYWTQLFRNLNKEFPSMDLMHFLTLTISPRLHFHFFLPQRWCGI